MRSLLITEGPLAGQRISVETQLVVGRVDADLTIDDPLISRRHAVIRQAGDLLEVEDLGSLNGTWVNGERLEAPRALGAGDVVRLGSASFEVEGERVESGGTILAPAPPQEQPPDAGRISAAGTPAGARQARLDGLIQRPRARVARGDSLRVHALRLPSG